MHISIIALFSLVAFAQAIDLFPNKDNGKAIVHLFEWKWVDIARECEDFLAPTGYAGVQISPPNENAVINDAQGRNRPWYERYQPVSYILETRSGTREEFIDMVERCNAVGVRIYADAVINHMSAGDLGTNVGTAGSPTNYTYYEYPAVPYDYSSFHNINNGCPTSDGKIHGYSDPVEVRCCELYGLRDLDHKRSPGTEIPEYLNDLISIGVDGFRIDAAKHIFPLDLEEMLSQVNDTVFGERPFIYQEVIDLHDPEEGVTADEYFDIGRVTEFNYGYNLAEVFNGPTSLAYLQNFYGGSDGWGMMNSKHALVFVENQDTQRTTGNVLTFRDTKVYKMAVGFMLAWPYGYPRVMSSFNWEQLIVDDVDVNSWFGPPHDENMNTLNVDINEDGSCAGDWVCEHRWRQIANMVTFRKVVEGTGVEAWWDNGSNQIAFCRGNLGFVAINQDAYDMAEYINTCLPAGTYCDVISGDLVDGACTGKSIQVFDSSVAYVEIGLGEEDGIFAIHVGAKL